MCLCNDVFMSVLCCVVVIAFRYLFIYDMVLRVRVCVSTYWFMMVSVYVCLSFCLDFVIYLGMSLFICYVMSLCMRVFSSAFINLCLSVCLSVFVMLCISFVTHLCRSLLVYVLVDVSFCICCVCV